MLRNTFNFTHFSIPTTAQSITRKLSTTTLLTATLASSGCIGDKLNGMPTQQYKNVTCIEPCPLQFSNLKYLDNQFYYFSDDKVSFHLLVGTNNLDPFMIAQYDKITNNPNNGSRYQRLLGIEINPNSVSYQAILGDYASNESNPIFAIEQLPNIHRLLDKHPNGEKIIVTDIMRHFYGLIYPLSSYYSFDYFMKSMNPEMNSNLLYGNLELQRQYEEIKTQSSIDNTNIAKETTNESDDYDLLKSMNPEMNSDLQHGNPKLERENKENQTLSCIDNTNIAEETTNESEYYYNENTYKNSIDFALMTLTLSSIMSILLKNKMSSNIKTALLPSVLSYIFTQINSTPENLIPTKLPVQAQEQKDPEEIIKENMIKRQVRKIDYVASYDPRLEGIIDILSTDFTHNQADLLDLKKIGLPESSLPTFFGYYAPYLFQDISISNEDYDKKDYRILRWLAEEIKYYNKVYK